MNTEVGMEIYELERRADAAERTLDELRGVLGLEPGDNLPGAVRRMQADLNRRTGEIKRAHEHLAPYVHGVNSVANAAELAAAQLAEWRGRVEGALNNLALYTDSREIEDAALEVADRLRQAETRLEALEDERLQALADDVNEALPTREVVMSFGGVQIKVREVQP